MAAKDIPLKLIENRCPSCGKLFLKSNILHGTFEYLCSCGTLSVVKVQPEKRQ
jgi:hypothetical protein